jgi:hypothetical protein
MRTWSQSCVGGGMLLIAAAAGPPAAAQATHGNADLIGNPGLIDSILATPNRKTPVPQDNDFATAPGVEQPTPAPRFTLNVLAPLFVNSNPLFLSRGGTAALEGSPVVRLGWASQLFGSPIRFSGAASLEWERYANQSAADIDYFRSSARLQYTPPGDDQGFSPFFSYVPRMDFDPTLADNFATRQDLNLGVDKVFNFDGAFNRLPAGTDSGSAAVWSLGYAIGGQRRFRSPSPQSWALFFSPSVGWVISDQWNASFSATTTRRWFDTSNAVGRRDLTLEPTAVVEYIIPSRWVGGDNVARALGSPAVDFFTLFERNWSSVRGGTYSQWVAGFVLKTGWRF